MREETCCCHYMSYSFRLAARSLLYAPYHRQVSTYHSLCYTDGWLEWQIAQWVHHEGLIQQPIAQWANALNMELHFTPYAIRKEGNVLLNDALNIFYLRLYGVSHRVKDHSDSDRGNPLPPQHELLFLISSKGSFICTTPDRLAHTMAFVTPVMEHWLEWEWLSGSTMKDRSNNPLDNERTLLAWSYISLPMSLGDYIELILYNLDQQSMSMHKVIFPVESTQTLT